MWNSLVYARAIAGMIDFSTWPFYEPRDTSYLWLEFVQCLVLIAFSAALYWMKRIAFGLLVLAATIEILAITMAIKDDPLVSSVVYGLTIATSFLGFVMGLLYVRYLRHRGILK